MFIEQRLSQYTFIHNQLQYMFHLTLKRSLYEYQTCLCKCLKNIFITFSSADSNQFIWLDWRIQVHEFQFSLSGVSAQSPSILSFTNTHLNSPLLTINGHKLLSITIIQNVQDKTEHRKTGKGRKMRNLTSSNDNHSIPSNFDHHNSLSGMFTITITSTQYFTINHHLPISIINI